jgi:hypothetical protein
MNKLKILRIVLNKILLGGFFMSEFENERSVENIKDCGGIIETEKAHKGLRCETGCDFTLPDYMGDIKRIIDVGCDVIPSGKFDGSGEVSFCGIVSYKVLYTDSENKPTLAEFTSDYEVCVKCDDAYIDGAALTELSSLSVRPQGPRKLCAKASLSSDVYICSEREVPVLEGCDGVEKNTAQISVHSAEYLPVGEREYAEEAARLEGVACEELEVLSTGACVRIDKVTVETDGVRFVGAIETYALLNGDDDSVVRIEKDIPIDESLECDSENVGALPLARGYVTSFKVNINNDGLEGDICSSVVFSATAEYEVFVDRCRIVSVVRDAYTVGTKSTADYECVPYSSVECTVSENQNVSFEVPRDELSCDNITQILHTQASVKERVLTLSPTNIKVSGEVNFCTVVKSAGEESYLGIKNCCPFEFCVQIDAGDAPIKLGRFCLTPYSASSSVDSGKLYLKCSLSMYASVLSEREENVVTSLTVSDDESEKDGVVTVYYPDEKDSLWSVGKKYGVSLSKLAKDNALSEGAFASAASSTSLHGVDRIIIAK